MSTSAAGSSSFPRSARLLNSKEFTASLGSKRRVASEQFWAAVYPSPEHGPRLGLVMPKRLARRAHERNRLKRLVREWFRKARPALPPLWIVVGCRSGAVTSDNECLWQDLDRLHRRLQRLPDLSAVGTIRGPLQTPTP